jgi:hypothetical protein
MLVDPYASNAIVKYYVAHKLLQISSQQITLAEAAQAARVPPSALKCILKADDVFKVDPAQAGEDGATTISINPGRLLTKANEGSGARKQTSRLSIISKVANKLKAVREPALGFTNKVCPVRPGMD